MSVNSDTTIHLHFADKEDDQTPTVEYIKGTGFAMVKIGSAPATPVISFLFHTDTAYSWNADPDTRDTRILTFIDQLTAVLGDIRQATMTRIQRRVDLERERVAP